MAFIGRKTLKSERARTRHIDLFFERVAYTLLLSYTLFVIISILSYDPSLQMKSITVEGVRGADRAAVDTIAQDALSWRFFSRVDRNNIFFYPRSSVRHAIIALDPRIKQATLTFDSLHRLRITIEEYTPSLLYCGAAGSDERVAALVVGSTTQMAGDAVPRTFTDCYFADERGYVFAKAPEWSGYPYITVVASSSSDTEGEQTSFAPLRTFALPREEYQRVRTFLNVLTHIDLYPRALTVIGEHDFRISTALPWDILWSSDKDPQKSADNLALVLNSLAADKASAASLKMIDLRFGNKIFYK